MMGGGDEFFNASKRRQKRCLQFVPKKGYQILKNRSDLQKAEKGKKLLGF
jgi:alkaline phosphatase